MNTLLAPAFSAASLTARFSTAVTPDGMHIITLAFVKNVPLRAFLINSWSRVVVMSKSAITPSLRGLTAIIEPGVLPITSFALFPTYLALSVRVSTATTEGSRMIMPLPLIKTRVLAVPRSIPMSFVNIFCISPLCSFYIIIRFFTAVLSYKLIIPPNSTFNNNTARKIVNYVYIFFIYFADGKIYLSAYHF